MKKKFAVLLAALMSFVMIATACNNEIEDGSESGEVTLPATEVTTTAAPVTEPATEAVTTTPEITTVPPVTTTAAPETTPAVTKVTTTAAPVTTPAITTVPPVTTTAAPATSPKPVGMSKKYVYNLLSADEKYLYDTILEGVKNFEPRITFNKAYDSDLVYKTWKNVFYQQPELFWFKGTLSGGYGADYICPDYLYTKSEVAVMQPKVDAAMKNILDSLPANATDVQKITKVHDALALKADYTKENKHAPNIYGVLVGGYAQCAGYAKAMLYMCEQMGYEATHIAGYRIKDNGSHGWIKVKLDGKWYNIDLTWDDPMGKTDKTFYVHQYLLIPDSQLTHVADDTYTPPKANSLDKNYFVQNGLYVTKTSQTPGIMKQELIKAADGKRGVAEFKCANMDLWTDARIYLASNQAQLIKDINASSKYKVAKIMDYSKQDTLTIQINIEFQ